GCRDEARVAPHAVEPTSSIRAPVASAVPAATTEPIPGTIHVKGFDPEGEPEIRTNRDGSITIAFAFMPPSCAADHDGGFDDFDKQLERARGVAVARDDREVFVIRQPAPETAQKARAFLESYRKRTAR